MAEQFKTRVFKTRAEKRGGHMHVTVFSANAPDQTFANIGTLVMDVSDYVAFNKNFNAQHGIPEIQEDVF